MFITKLKFKTSVQGNAHLSLLTSKMKRTFFIEYLHPGSWIPRSCWERSRAGRVVGIKRLYTSVG